MSILNSQQGTFTVSIIIPTLNEIKTLPYLIKSLAKQKGITFEVVVADGGSHDETLQWCKQQTFPFPLRAIKTPSGRSRQMNAAAHKSYGEELLFLHADSVITDNDLLARAYVCMKQHRKKSFPNNTAGHFPLKFIRTQHESSTTIGAYYFFEAKTSLNRLDCINGDQGMWLSRTYFKKTGGFNETLPYMEDARLARIIFKTGHWITLPGSLETSARRFESEGFKPRQILNALLCNFDTIGMTSFFGAAANAYKSQNHTKRLDLKPFFIIAHQKTFEQGLKKAAIYWYKTGQYIADNAWQLAFIFDCKNNRKKNIEPHSIHHPILNFYDKWLAPIITSPFGVIPTTLLALIWFYSSIFFGRVGKA
ncbi:MAG: glycosyltransferase [Gammaproteobacteria bacterium]|nr:glycosyltransferase [Gammaproteobacteria bacterium]